MLRGGRNTHNGEEDNEDGDDGHNSGVLAGLGVLKQEPDPSIERNGHEVHIVS